MEKLKKLFKLKGLLFFVTLSCFSQVVPPPPNCFLETTWNGVSWNPVVPDQNYTAIFDADYSSTGNVICCSVIVQNGKNVVFNQGHILKSFHSVSVFGTLTFENNSSLVQVNDNAINYGNIVYKRNSTPIRNNQYTYWSSPVGGQSLIGLSSSNELPHPSLYFHWDTNYTPSWNPTVNIGGSWIQIPNTTIMEPGKGYIFRGPQSYASSGIQHITYTGPPNNGVITEPVNGVNITINTSNPCIYPPNFTNLLGNPYPSALDADSFLNSPLNSNTIEGTIALYTHNVLGNFNEGYGNGLQYSARDFVYYNRLGGVATGKLNSGSPLSVTNSNRPTGKIASGQGFFVDGMANSFVTFNNDMRIDGSVTGDTNAEFYRNISNNDHQYSEESTKKDTDIEFNRINPIEKHRIWFSIENTSQGGQGIDNFYESLVGYCTGATIGHDRSFDFIRNVAETPLKIYSLPTPTSVCNAYTIQGRPLPFNVDDVIPLGFIATVTGSSQNFKIEAFGDGMFQNGGQKYYLKDNLLGIIHDIQNNPYLFSLSASEINNSRFEIIFSKCPQPINEPQMSRSLIAPLSGMHHWVITNLSTGLVANFDTLGSVFTFSQLPTNSSLLNLSYSGNTSGIIPANLFFSYGDNYFIQSFVNGNLVYSCQHNMPLLTPEMSNCSFIVIPSKSTLFSTYGVNSMYSSATGTILNNGTQNTNLTGLRYQISSDISFSTFHEIIRVYPQNLIIHHIKLEQFNSVFLPNTTYFIRVAARNSRLFWMPFGNICTITTTANYFRENGSITSNDEKKLSIYPNPFTDNFTIDFNETTSENVNIKVYDMLGRFVEEKLINVSENNAIYLGENYNLGIYNVVIFDGDEIKTFKLIKN